MEATDLLPADHGRAHTNAFGDKVMKLKAGGQDATESAGANRRGDQSRHGLRGACAQRVFKKTDRLFVEVSA
jgi:hypothetical protein